MVMLSEKLLDMGEAQVDDKRQIEAAQLPALNTTKLIEQEMKERDLLLHIGDITGYAGVVIET